MYTPPPQQVAPAPAKPYVPPPYFTGNARRFATPPSQPQVTQIIQPAPTPPPQTNVVASGALPQLLSLIQNQQIMGALGDLLNTGISRLTNIGSDQTPVSESGFLNAISEFARIAQEELESLGTGDNLNYMRDNNGQWKYDPNISTYRAEALYETIQS